MAVGLFGLYPSAPVRYQLPDGFLMRCCSCFVSTDVNAVVGDLNIFERGVLLPPEAASDETALHGPRQAALALAETDRSVVCIRLRSGGWIVGFGLRDRCGRFGNLGFRS